jgi:transposase
MTSNLSDHAFYKVGQNRYYSILRRYIMQKHVVGIDVSKKTLDVCAIFGEKTKKNIFENTEAGFNALVVWTQKLQISDPHFCMEATGCYSEEISEFLYNSGFKVSVVNPLLIKSFRTSKMIRQKTDSSDAEVIARFCLQNDPKVMTPKPRENKELHEINFRLDSLREELNRLTNFLEKKMLNESVKKSIDDEIDFIKKTIKKLENEAQKIIESTEKLQKKFEHLTSIKGVGARYFGRHAGRKFVRKCEAICCVCRCNSVVFSVRDVGQRKIAHLAFRIIENPQNIVYVRYGCKKSYSAFSRLR